MSILNEDWFKSGYGSAKITLEKAENHFYLELLEECYNNEKYMNFMILANDFYEAAPTKSFLLLYKERLETKGEIKDRALKQAIGSYWGAIFTKILHKPRLKNARVGILGIATATVFQKS